MFYTGIDLHKNFSNLTTVDEKGMVVEQQKIYNNPEQIDSTTMAQLLRIDYVPEAHQIDPILRDKRDLMRARLRLIQRRTCIVNSICRLTEKFNVTNPDDLPGLYRFQYQQLNRHVNFLNEQVKELDKTIYPQVVLNEDVQRILWIPGIGKISAFTIHLEVGDFSRFPTTLKYGISIKKNAVKRINTLPEILSQRNWPALCITS